MENIIERHNVDADPTYINIHSADDRDYCRDHNAYKPQLIIVNRIPIYFEMRIVSEKKN